MHPAHGGDSKRLNSSYAFSILTASKVQRSGATYALWSHQKLAAAAGHATLGRGFGTVQKTWSFFFCCQNRIFLHPFSINFNNFSRFLFLFQQCGVAQETSNNPEVRIPKLAAPLLIV